MQARSLQPYTQRLIDHHLITGGIGVIGGVRQSPKFLQGSIDELKSYLDDKEAPFGVDLLLPQVGGSARKTNVSGHHTSAKQFIP
jgi:hypothetical protein